MRAWGPTPLLMALMLAACASTPPPEPRNTWQGRELSVPARERGDAIADFALGLRGTPYRYGGATRAGFDCSGLVFFAHRNFGVSVPRTSRDQARKADTIKRHKLKRGDLVFFRIDSRKVDHVGIYVGDDYFVHAPGAGKAVSLNSLDDDYYADAFVAGGRYWDRD